MSNGKLLTEAEKTYIVEARSNSVSWRDIAIALGRPNSASALCTRFKAGFASTCKYVCTNCGGPTSSERKLCNKPHCQLIYHREIARKNWLWYQYGLTPEAHTALLKAQNGKCPICHCELTEENMHTDHDHKTNKVRGITCRKHNNGMGFFDDDPALLRAAADYLEGGILVDETINYLAEVST